MGDVVEFPMPAFSCHDCHWHVPGKPDGYCSFLGVVVEDPRIAADCEDYEPNDAQMP